MGVIQNLHVMPHFQPATPSKQNPPPRERYDHQTFEVNSSKSQQNIKANSTEKTPRFHRSLHNDKNNTKQRCCNCSEIKSLGIFPIDTKKLLANVFPTEFPSNGIPFPRVVSFPRTPRCKRPSRRTHPPCAPPRQDWPLAILHSSIQHHRPGTNGTKRNSSQQTKEVVSVFFLIHGSNDGLVDMSIHFKKDVFVKYLQLQL